MVLKLRDLVFRQMLKNMKHYYLYFFALIFSVMLYFAFSTLQYNGQVLEEIVEGGTAAAGFKVATYLLWFIVLVFVLYANHLFMRRRGKEVGMYQLIGMTKGLVFRLLALENAVLFLLAVSVGVLGGFLGSRLFAMILLKVIGSKVIVGIDFSVTAMLETFAVFGILLVIILGQLFIFIQRQTLLQAFQTANQTDEKIQKFNVWHMLLGLVGLGLIIYGYYASTVMFEGPGTELVRRMVIVLATTITGTFLIFRYSVALLINMWRTRKNGHVSRGDVVALLPIMHRMKSNAKSLTLIAVLTAVSLGINTLAYISYYTAEQTVLNDLPADYIVVNDKADDFAALLNENDIEYERTDFDYVKYEFDFPALLEKREDANGAGYYVNNHGPVIAASTIGAKLQGNEALIYGFNGYTTNLFEFKDSGTMDLYEYVNGQQQAVALQVLEVNKDSLLNTYAENATQVSIVIADALYEELTQRGNYFGENTETQFNLKNSQDEQVARKLYESSGANVWGSEMDRIFISQQQSFSETKKMLGFIIFVTAFLGLAFLVASGSILYFKQMSEAEQEKGSYTILRKIGYSERDLMNGVYKKQLFNYGVPIVIGLFHSYFAVKSGWWFFGTEFAVPMVTMMILYVIIYIAFALLTVLYYKKIVKSAL